MFRLTKPAEDALMADIRHLLRRLGDAWDPEDVAARGTMPPTQTVSADLMKDAARINKILDTVVYDPKFGDVVPAPCCYCGKPCNGDDLWREDWNTEPAVYLPLCIVCAGPEVSVAAIRANLSADCTKASADACPHCGLGADLCPPGSRHDCAIVNSLPTHGEAMALPGHAEAERREHPSEPPRCERCHWPLKATIEEGCTVGNCSYRGPKPEGAGADADARLCTILARRTDGVGNVDAHGVLDDVQALVCRDPGPAASFAEALVATVAGTPGGWDREQVAALVAHLLVGASLDAYPEVAGLFVGARKRVERETAHLARCVMSGYVPIASDGAEGAQARIAAMLVRRGPT